MLSSVELEKSFLNSGSGFMRLPLNIQCKIYVSMYCLYSVIYMTMHLSGINHLFLFLLIMVWL